MYLYYVSMAVFIKHHFTYGWMVKWQAFITFHNSTREDWLRGADPFTKTKLVPIHRLRKDSRLGEPPVCKTPPGVEPSTSRLRVLWANHYSIAPDTVHTLHNHSIAVYIYQQLFRQLRLISEWHLNNLSEVIDRLIFAGQYSVRCHGFKLIATLKVVLYSRYQFVILFS